MSTQLALNALCPPADALWYA